METYTADGPSPQACEQADDTTYANDFAVTVDVLRSQLEQYAYTERHQGRPASVLLLQWVLTVVANGPRLASDEWLAGFLESYALPAVLRACATAIEQHAAGIPRPDAPLEHD